MCGIAGIVGDSDSSAVERMVAVMRHRGPDDRGFYRDPTGRCALGHARLAIIDTSAAGRQPMEHAGRYWITYNGEIYNFREIRAELERAGHSFGTGSDTEVLLAAYVAWGPGCLDRLSGMFAFGVWDAQAGELFLARDRLGIKPLYMAKTVRGLVFASEIRSVLASGLVERTADSVAISDFLTLGVVPQPRTIVAGVEMLLPGHYAVFRDGRLHTTEFWSYRDVSRRPRGAIAADGPEPARRLRELLEAATARHLVADVPIGAFLSGGIDSRIVVGLMSRVSRGPIRTFTIGFEGAAGYVDERNAAREAASAFGCIHTEAVLTSRDAFEAAGDILAAVDQPSVDGFNTWFVCRAAREAVTVALSGLGGDELFAGYGHFASLARLARLAPNGIGWLRPLAGVLAEVPPRRVGRALERLASDQAGRIEALRRLHRHDVKRAILQPALARVSDDHPVTDYCRSLLGDTGDSVNDLCVAEVTGYLRNTLLRDADAMSMAHSLEVRPVLLDHEVVEFAAGLPGASKVGGALGKQILLSACRDLLPEDIAAQTKRGFEIPIVGWVGSRLGSVVADTLAGARAESVFTPRFLAQARAAVTQPASPDRSWWPAFLLLDYLERHDVRIAA